MAAAGRARFLPRLREGRAFFYARYFVFASALAAGLEGETGKRGTAFG
jgi:hypothetical protein